MMSLATPEAPAIEVAEAAVQWPYRMSLELYEQLAELQLIRSDERVVLLDGILVQTMTQGAPHFNAVDRGREALGAALPAGWSVRADGPVRLRTGPLGASEPEPNLAVVFGSRENFETRPPEAAEVGLIVEVASDAAAFLVDRKGLARYAYAQIPLVWIVTLADRQVHVYSEPSGPAELPGYARVDVRQVGALLEADLSCGLADRASQRLGPVAVASFFPPNS